MISFLFKHKNLSKKGFTLAEIVIAGGVMGIVAFGTMQIFKSQLKSEKSAMSLAEESELVRRIRTVLSDKTACTFTLAGRCGNYLSGYTSQNSCTLNADGVTSSGRSWTAKNLTNGESVTSIRNNRGQEIMYPGFQYGGAAGKEHFEVDTITLAPQGSWPGNNTKGTVLLQVVLKNLQKNPVTTVTKLVEVPVKIGSSGNIVECFSNRDETIMTARQRSCADIGGTWSTANNYCVFTDKSDASTAQNSEGTNTDVLVRRHYVNKNDCNAPGLRWDTANHRCLVDYSSTYNHCADGQIATNVRIRVGGANLTNNMTVQPDTEYTYRATCVPVAKSCSTGDVITGINSNGSPICSGANSSCVAGQTAVLTPAGWQCVTTCNDGEISNIYYNGTTLTVQCLACGANEVGVLGPNGTLLCSNIGSGCTSTSTTIKSLQMGDDGKFTCTTLFEVDEDLTSCTSAEIMWGLKITDDDKIIPRCCEPQTVPNLTGDPACNATTAAGICNGAIHPCYDHDDGEECGSITGLAEDIDCSVPGDYPYAGDATIVNQTCNANVIIHDMYGQDCKSCPGRFGVTRGFETSDCPEWEDDFNLDEKCPNIDTPITDHYGRYCGLTCPGTIGTSCDSAITSQMCPDDYYEVTDNDGNACGVQCFGTSPWLKNGVHCEKECTDIGGTLNAFAGSDQNYCELSGNTVPDGWQEYRVYRESKECTGTVGSCTKWHTECSNSESYCPTNPDSCQTGGGSWYEPHKYSDCDYDSQVDALCDEAVWIFGLGYTGNTKGCKREFVLFEGDVCNCNDTRAYCRHVTSEDTVCSNEARTHITKMILF